MAEASHSSLSPPPTASSSRSGSRPVSPPNVGSPPLHGILKTQQHRHRSTGSATSATGLPPLDLTDTQLSPQPSSVAFERTSTQQSGSGNLHYTRGVAFDTFEAGDDLKTGGGTGVDLSFTLQSKSVGYQRTRVSRTFLVATDLNEYSVNALNWALHNLVEDGDEVVVLRVVEPGASSQRVVGDQEEARQEAQEVMDSIMDINGDDRNLSIVVEFAIGRLNSTIQRMIQIYRPDSLIVGTRGRTDSMWRAAFMGSTSRYMLEHSPVPVVVVRPERKVKRDIDARRANPKRGASVQSNRTSIDRPVVDRRQSHSPARIKTADSGELQVPGEGKLAKLKSVPLKKTRTAPA